MVLPADQDVDGIPVICDLFGEFGAVGERRDQLRGHGRRQRE